MLSYFDVSVYNGSFYNGSTRSYETYDFIYIGFIGYDNKRQNIILTDIEAVQPSVRIVKRSDIAQHMLEGSVRCISVQHLLNLMKKVLNVPQIAQTAWNNAYNVHLQQWVESMYFEKSCKKIQKAWLNAYYNPSFVFCNTRLNKEFCEMSENL